MTKLNTTGKVIRKKNRIGRGIGSGKGKTSGRGVKGQKSRSGVAIKSFEGGQMPLYRRLPKRGFNPIKKDKTAILNLKDIQNLIDKNIIKANEKINIQNLKKNKILKNSFTKFKVLGTGEIKVKLDIVADSISKSAKEKIDKVGGKTNSQ